MRKKLKKNEKRKTKILKAIDRLKYKITAKENHGKSAEPKWNFHKILINKEGKVQNTFSSFTKPTSKKIIKAIESVL